MHMARIIPVVALLGLGACAGTQGGYSPVARGSMDALSFQSVSSQEAHLLAQAAALDTLAGDLVQRIGRKDRAVPSALLARKIKPMSAHMAEIGGELSRILAAQNAELTALAAMRGPEAQAIFEARSAEVGAARRDLVQVLNVSEEQLRAVVQRLDAVAGQEQTGLTEHRDTIARMAEASAKARGSIRLF